MRVSKHRTALLAITMLLALGAFAPAAWPARWALDGGTLVFDRDDNLNHEVQFRLAANGIRSTVYRPDLRHPEHLLQPRLDDL